MTGPQISATNVGKRYVKYVDTPTLISRIPRPGRTKRSMLWALRGASFEVAPGEGLGVIGRNGSGKSTLLRMLAGVTAPTEGRVKIAGRVAPLIAVGVGFHPELTGRENVYVNGIVLGLTREELDERFDDIVRFAEIKPFIDTPVKFYSSGMFVRLGFAVSVLAEPDVLLVDEVLAVGDINFQLKCYERMQELQERGTTIVVVSHNLIAVRNMCKRTLVIHDGEMKFDGDTTEAISLYHDYLSLPRPGMEDEVIDHSEVLVDIVGEVESFEMLDGSHKPTRHVGVEQTVTFEAMIRIDRSVEAPIVVLNIYNGSGVLVYGTVNSWKSEIELDAGTVARVAFTMPLRLATDSYTANLGMANSRGAALIAPPQPLLFYVAGSPFAQGICDLGAEIDISTKPGSSTATAS